MARRAVLYYCTGRGVVMRLLQGTPADYAPCPRMVHRRGQLGKQGATTSPTARAPAAKSAIDTRPNPTLQTGPICVRHNLLGQFETNLPADAGAF